MGNNIETGIYSMQKAKQIANDLELDLVLINPNGVPPVYKLIDEKKFIYEQKLRKREQQKHSKKTVTKEIRIGYNIGANDYEIKKKRAIKFLNKGAKLKVSMFFKGRAIVHKDLGHILLLKLATELEEYGKVDQMPKLLGKRMIMQITSKK